MDKNILVSIVAMDKSVPITDVEPLNLAGDIGRQNFAWLFLQKWVKKNSKKIFFNFYRIFRHKLAYLESNYV